MSPNPQEVLDHLKAEKIAAQIAEIENLKLQFTKIKYEIDHSLIALEKLKKVVNE